MRNLKAAIVFIDQNFRTKVYQLERYALKKFESPESYKLIYFDDLDIAEKFVNESKIDKSCQKILMLQQQMRSNISEVREKFINDQKEAISDIQNNLQNAFNFKINYIQETNVDNTNLQNRLDQQHVKPKQNNIMQDNYNILNEIQEKIQKQETVSRQRLISLEKLDQKYQHYLNYYPKNLNYVPIKQDRLFTLYFDGASKKNPGPAGAGIVLFQNLEIIQKISQPLGVQTNNVAEFLALFYGIKYALSIGVNDLECYGDSKLIIDGMNRQIKFKQDHLESIRKMVEEYTKLFRTIKYQHIPRNQNEIADKLSSDAAKIESKDSI